MSLLDHHWDSRSLPFVTQTVDPIAMLTRVGRRTRRWLRQRLCFALNGGHELYRAHTETRLYQQCLLCGYETTGWTIDRRDRRTGIAHQTPKAVG
jgi:hypothetical protein